MRRVLFACACLSFGLAPAAPAFAFGTINGLGQSAQHEKITRRAVPDMEPRSLSELAGKRGTFGAVGAADKPRGQLFGMSEPHCDNGDYLPAPGYPKSAADAQRTLEGCKAWIGSQMESAVRAAAPLARPTPEAMRLDCDFSGDVAKPAGSPKCQVLRHLGLALHAAQDFYSHTNWADQADPGRPVGPENPPGLGQLGRRAPWLDLRYAAPFPQGLISGCYAGAIEAAHCNYAGEGKRRTKQVKHEALNKDKGAIDGQSFRPARGPPTAAGCWATSPPPSTRPATTAPASGPISRSGSR